MMEGTLRAAGFPPRVLAYIPEIIDTCRECRAWTKHGPDVTPSVGLTQNQNEAVEGDIMFYKQYMVWHMVDRADRWHAGTQISSKSTESLCDAIAECWLPVVGPFKRLIADGESGLNSEAAKAFLNGNGIMLDTRAVDNTRAL